MITALDIFFAVAALVAVMTGLAPRALPPGRTGSPRNRNWKALLGFVVLHRPLFVGRVMVGLMHLFLVWGLLLFLLVVLLAQAGIRVPTGVAPWASGLLDLAGLVMLAATLFFIIRRRLRDRTDADGPNRVVLPLLILLVILISGFLSAGARLHLMQAHWSWASPVGGVLAILPASPLYMQVMLRVHFLSVLLFFAVLPWTFMRHLYFSAANLFFHSPTESSRVPASVDLVQGPWGASRSSDLNYGQMRQIAACVACGRCDEVCPANRVGQALSPRQFVAAFGRHLNQDDDTASTTEGIGALVSDEALWACTSCLACVYECPAKVDPLDKILSVRRYRALVQGALPEEVQPLLRNLYVFGDVAGKGPALRAEWATTQPIARFGASTEHGCVLLWVGCAGALNPRHRQTVLQLVRILNAAKVPFGILGEAEQCCGDPARRLGDEALFDRLANANARLFAQKGINHIVTLCPHCFHTIKNEYPRFAPYLMVSHATAFVAELVRTSRIVLKYPRAATAAIHDPCYLGRYNGVYEPLRALCHAIPGLVLQELPRHGKNGFCCGGGGGRMWLHDNHETKINHQRAGEMAASRVSIAATACPYCLTMLEDGLNGLPLQIAPRAADIITLVADAMG